MPIKHGHARSINVPYDFMQILPSPVNQQKTSPVFPSEVTFDMYHRHERITQMSFAKDIAWLFVRAEVMPIINEPAHDFDTFWTVMQNCQTMTNKTWPTLHYYNFQ